MVSEAQSVKRKFYKTHIHPEWNLEKSPYSITKSSNSPGNIQNYKSSTNYRREYDQKTKFSNFPKKNSSLHKDKIIETFQNNLQEITYNKKREENIVETEVNNGWEQNWERIKKNLKYNYKLIYRKSEPRIIKLLKCQKWNLLEEKLKLTIKYYKNQLSDFKTNHTIELQQIENYYEAFIQKKEENWIIKYQEFQFKCEDKYQNVLLKVNIPV